MKHNYKIKIRGLCNYRFENGEQINVDWYECELYTGNGSYKSRESAERGINEKICNAEQRGGWKNLKGKVIEK